MASVIPERVKLMLDKMIIESDNGRIENTWEDSFIQDLKTRVKQGHPLTPRQLSKLEDIFERN